MIDVRELRFAYPHSPFRLVVPRLTIADNTSTAVVGPSGSGKTTLLHLLAGILRPDAGSIQVDNADIAIQSDAARRRFRLTNVGLVFQNFELIDYLNVLDNVLLPCRIGRSIPLNSATRRRAEELLERSGLAEHQLKSVTRLSQGERQRVAICRALLTAPRLILADEPTGNLDPETSARILTLLLSFVQDHQSALLMVTHDHSLLPHFSSVVDFRQFLTTAPGPDESDLSRADGTHTADNTDRSGEVRR
ncbi:MAG: ABC transporter ATP-binding protein [Planctomycetaceae bacterium]|nr:ABC transporter ATP-binding protein [Planctomycetaceae bacterium]